MLTAEQKKLVEDNWRLVRFVIKKYFRNGQGYPVEYEDMEQIGYLGLCKAARDYDPSRGVKFSTLATLAISNAILKHLRALNMPKRRPKLSPVSLQQKYFNTAGNSTTLAEIIPDKGMSIEDQILVKLIIRQLISEFGKDLRTNLLIECCIGEIPQHIAAKRLGISQPQVSRLCKAYKRHVLEAIGE